jgi:hypothetical protein
MPKGIPYAGEFKQEVIETMHKEKLGIRETAKRFGILHKCVLDWERIYLEESVEGLYKDRRGQSSAANGVQKGRKPKLPRQVEKDLISENQRLRAEVEYLKNLNALVREKEQRERKRKWSGD